MDEFITNKFLYNDRKYTFMCKYCNGNILSFNEDPIYFRGLEDRLSLHLMECGSYQIYLRQVGKYI